MKKSIHPHCEVITATCNCKAKHHVISVACQDIKIDRCSKCHEAYTGWKGSVHSLAGPVKKFQEKYGLLKS